MWLTWTWSSPTNIPVEMYIDGQKYDNKSNNTQVHIKILGMLHGCTNQHKDYITGWQLTYARKRSKLTTWTTMNIKLFILPCCFLELSRVLIKDVHLSSPWCVEETCNAWQHTIWYITGVLCIMFKLCSLGHRNRWNKAKTQLPFPPASQHARN